VNHRIARNIFGLVVGVAVAVFAFSWITDSESRAGRAMEERAVQAARRYLQEKVGAGLEVVDPLSPDRKVGKVYVYPEPPGWAVSGFYRRSSEDRWHPYLARLTAEFGLSHLKVRDPALAGRAAGDPQLEASR